MADLVDDEFGVITIRRSNLAKSLKVSVAPNGTIRISMPKYAPQFLAKRLLNSSRASIRTLIQASEPVAEYHDGMQIGKSHSIAVRNASTFSVKRSGQVIYVSLPPDSSLTDTAVKNDIREATQQAIRKEAKSYLPKRLKFLADQHGYSYNSVRFSHASTRWGSCSSNGTISLNIALMKLDFDLIDYVLLHELTHTIHMNHSDSFWSTLAITDPQFKHHKASLKNETPSI